jgi:hypothetical protein
MQIQGAVLDCSICAMQCNSQEGCVWRRWSQRNHRILSKCALSTDAATHFENCTDSQVSIVNQLVQIVNVVYKTRHTCNQKSERVVSEAACLQCPVPGTISGRTGLV